MHSTDAEGANSSFLSDVAAPAFVLLRWPRPDVPSAWQLPFGGFVFQNDSLWRKLWGRAGLLRRALCDTQISVGSEADGEKCPDCETPAHSFIAR